MERQERDSLPRTGNNNDNNDNNDDNNDNNNNNNYKNGTTCQEQVCQPVKLGISNSFPFKFDIFAGKPWFGRIAHFGNPPL